MVAGKIKNISGQNHHAIFLDHLRAELLDGSFAIPTRKRNRTRVRFDPRERIRVLGEKVFGGGEVLTNDGKVARNDCFLCTQCNNAQDFTWRAVAYRRVIFEREPLVNQ